MLRRAEEKEGERREDMQMDQNGEESVLMRDNYRSSVHLSGGEEEIPGSAVEMEFHTETKINSPSAAPR